MPDPAYNLDRQVAQSILADHRDRLLPPIDTEPAAPIYPGDRGDQLFEEILIQDYVKVGFEATEADDVFTATDHGLAVGDVIVLLNPAGGPAGFPGGLTQTAAPDSLHKYAVYTVPDADTFTIEEIGGGAAVDVTADGDGYFVRLIDGRLMNQGVRQEYDQFAANPDWVDQDDVWVFDINDKELTVDERMPARRHGDAGPDDDRRVLYSVYLKCCTDDASGGGGTSGGTPVICGANLPTTIYAQLQEYPPGAYSIAGWPSFGTVLTNLTFTWDAAHGCYTCDTDVTISDGVGGTTDVKSWVMFPSVAAGVVALAVYGSYDDLSSVDLTVVPNDTYGTGMLAVVYYAGTCGPTHMFAIFAVFTNGGLLDLLSGYWCLLVKTDAW